MVVILELQNFLLNNRNTRKIFGKKEIQIILKQLDGITLNQSEKNRLSRDIRLKFKFMKDISNLKDEFNLKKNANNIKLIDKAVQLILKDELKNKILAILLFGSHVKGIVTKRSDIDICVLFTKITLKQATRFRIRISGEFQKNTDIQVFNILPKKIKRNIARNHKILYTNNDFDNLSFTIQHLKDEDYIIRKNKIFGEAA